MCFLRDMQCYFFALAMFEGIEILINISINIFLSSKILMFVLVLVMKKYMELEWKINV